MLQVKKQGNKPLIIKSMRKKPASDCSSSASCCSGETPPGADKPPCCGPPTSTGGGIITDKVPGFIAWLETACGPVPRISTKLTVGDHFGACKARWAMGRMNFIVPAGLYAIGHPTPSDPVLVTANYKMTYDIIRRSLSGRNIWLLVLETYGVNVWCAAGKGTFGTGELVRRIKTAGLAEIVNHRRLILPILGAPGVAAHEVTRRTGFKVLYGTIRADDLPEYLDSGMVTTPEMRHITFSLYDRLVLIPVELIMALKPIFFIGTAVFTVAALLGTVATAIAALCAYLGAVLAGSALGPLLLPWLPGRSFAVKGAFIGMIWSGIFYIIAGGSTWGIPATAALFLALPVISAFHMLNFTGCTTYTSRSGVKNEMRLALPIMGSSLVASLILLLAGRFL